MRGSGSARSEHWQQVSSSNCITRATRHAQLKQLHDIMSGSVLVQSLLLRRPLALVETWNRRSQINRKLSDDGILLSQACSLQGPEA